MKKRFMPAKTSLLIALASLHVLLLLNSTSALAQVTGVTRTEAIVLVNSTSANYSDFERYVQPYLNHFGIPYSVLNIATTPVEPSLSDYAVIIVGHRRLDIGNTYLDATEQNNIVGAVDAGTGLVNFDNDLGTNVQQARYQYITDIFNFDYVNPPTASGVTFSSTPHYIIERHQDADDDNPISTGNMTLAGVTLPVTVTVLATSGPQPFLAATAHGEGRAVQWGTYNWMSHAVKGPMYDLDDLVWRSIVWAARKPFVMQGMPPFVTMRVDDVSGPTDWIHIANEVGIKPWAGIFLNDINEAEAVDLAALSQAVSATIGIHAFTDPYSFYYNQYTGNWPDAVLAANYVTGTQWFSTHNITPSTYVAFHHYEVGTNAFAGLTDWGVQFVATHQIPGQPEWWPSAEEWWRGAPYRLYESGLSTSTRPVYYSDFITVPGHLEYNQKFFNCVTEVRDEQVYEWIPSNDVTASVYHGTRQLQRGLDNMAVPTLFAHQYNMVGISNTNWRAIMQGITGNLTSYDPQYVTMDYACQYARAMYTSNIAQSVYSSAQHLITTTFSGIADIPTQFYLFLDDAGQIRQQLINAPAFTGTVQVVTSDADIIPPAVSTVTPSNGATGVPLLANVTARFSEAISGTTINNSTFSLVDASSAIVPASVVYSGTLKTATLSPSSTLIYSGTYTATVKGGSAGVKDLAGNALASDYVWTFTTVAPPPLPPSEGPGGPIMIIASASNPFSRYYGEILRAEGLNAYTVTDISLVNATALVNQDVVILGEMSLAPAQVTMFSDWVNNGGNLIAMRPDKQLTGLLGLSDAGGTLSNAYLLFNAAQAPAAGLVTETIQYHGTADRYALAGSAAVATLYSDAATATSYPAVTLRSVGLNGGQAAAFTYDLARSVVYTRQGNPAWSGQNRDGDSLTRSNDLFYGNAAGDPQPDWIDFNKVAIPQADEQQRLLVNLITQMNLDRKPLPHFWYFPHGKKAVVIMTGDDHAYGGTTGTPGRFDQYLSASTSGCSVADWECIRSTAYIYPTSPITNTLAAYYAAQGFEISLHVTTECLNFTEASLNTDYTDQLAAFAGKYTSLLSPETTRTHCVVWSDWASQPKVELSHTVRLDTNYYAYPPAWIDDRPGMFTGSGLIMRFADIDGSLIDVYQATTQMNDEAGQTPAFTVDTLLDHALGPEGYYGAFTANMHNDSDYSPYADAIVASAQARNVPVVSARQMLNWLDGRNSSSFQNLAWSSNVLSFSVITGANTSGIQAMLPISSAVGTLTGVTRGGSSVAFTTQTIKGLPYAFFTASPGAYIATYGGLTAATYAAPGSACGGNTPCYSDLQAALTATTDGGTVYISGTHAVNAPLLTGWGGLRRVTLRSLSEFSGTLQYGGSDALFNIGLGNLVVKGLSLKTTSGITLFQHLSAASLLAYANNVTGFSAACGGGACVNSGLPHNWWGTSTYASRPIGLHTASWNARLGAAVATWSEGAGSAALTDSNGIATVTGGAGTAVIVNHGSTAPFFAATEPDICSNYFDVFVLAGATGNWSVSLPINVALCNAAPTKVSYIPPANLANANCDSAAPGCWASWVPVARIGNNFVAQNVPATILSGTPFVAGSRTGNSPTALRLIGLEARADAASSEPSMVGALAFALSLGLALLGIGWLIRGRRSGFKWGKRNRAER